MSNKGHENLVPQAHVLTVGEQSAGGKKSGEVRRYRRTAKDTLNILLGLPVKAGSVTDPGELENIKDKSNTDVNTRILVNLVKSALDGDTKAIQLLYTLTGEYNTRMQIEPQLVDNSVLEMDAYFARCLTSAKPQPEEPPQEEQMQEPQTLDEYMKNSVL